ncbi:MAG: hypothetical protein R2725_15665 [Solirubrobacterales bacterium]
MASPLGPLPPGFAPTVAALHQVAEQLIAPARKPENEISLRATAGGFGTPAFEFDSTRHQVRVEGGELVHAADGQQRRAALASLAEAGAAIADLLPAGTELDRAPLEVRPEAARALAEWYAFGERVLDRLAALAAPAEAPTRPRLWPEHFDIAIEMGEEAAGGRANYGLSPGDADHAEPYLYVGPWTASVSGPLWQARGFDGAELSYAELLAAADQEAAAHQFFVTRRDLLDTEERKR